MSLLQSAVERPIQQDILAPNCGNVSSTSCPTWSLRELSSTLMYNHSHYIPSPDPIHNESLTNQSELGTQIPMKTFASYSSRILIGFIRNIQTYPRCLKLFGRPEIYSRYPNLLVLSWKATSNVCVSLEHVTEDRVTDDIPRKLEKQSTHFSRAVFKRLSKVQRLFSDETSRWKSSLVAWSKNLI